MIFLGLLLITTLAYIPGVHVDRESQTFRDSQNRTLLFRGNNYVNKESPYYPHISKEEIKKMKELNFNVVRLGVMLPGLFPTSETPDLEYLSITKGIINELWAEGIATIIDLHQDVFSPKLCGEGVPNWMVNASELHSWNFPFPLTRKNLLKPDPATGNWKGELVCQPIGPLSFIGWSEFYMTDACGRAFQQLYDGTSLVAKMVDKYWQIISQELKSVDGVLAYELINEPWFGDIYRNPNLFLQAGLGEKKIMPFYQRLEKIIRSQDTNTLILYAPIEMNNRLMRHVGFEEGFMPGQPMAFHIYCLTGTDGAGATNSLTRTICNYNDNFSVKHREQDLKRLKTAGIVTEFGAVSDSDTGRQEIQFVTGHFDQIKISWIFWGNPFQSLKYQRILARTYPRVLAGELQYMDFDVNNGKFRMAFIPNSEEPTEIVLSRSLHYSQGFNIMIIPKNSCTYKVEDFGLSVYVKPVDNFLLPGSLPKLITIEIQRTD